MREQKGRERGWYVQMGIEEGKREMGHERGWDSKDVDSGGRKLGEGTIMLMQTRVVSGDRDRKRVWVEG